MPTWAQMVSALAVALGAYVAWRRSSVDRRQGDAGASASYASTLTTVLAQLAEFAKRLEEAERRADQHEADEHRCASELAQAKARISALERMLPMLLVSEMLEALTEPLRAALDEVESPIVVTTSSLGGSFVFANRAFCRAVGRQSADLLGQGWRQFLDPDFLGRTEEVEGLAHAVPVARFVNRYIRPDGGGVLLRWTAPPYNSKGATIAFARVLSSEGAA